MRLEDIAEIEERLGRETFGERLERLRREHAADALLPSPPPGAKPPPRAWSETDEDEA